MVRAGVKRGRGRRGGGGGGHGRGRGLDTRRAASARSPVPTNYLASGRNRELNRNVLNLTPLLTFSIANSATINRKDTLAIITNLKRTIKRYSGV